MRINLNKKKERSVDTVREDWTQTRLKLNRANDKSCSSVSDRRGFILKGLR